MSEIQKVYTLSIVGGKDAVNEVEALNTAFDKLRKVKQDLNEELGKALLNKESVEQVELLRKKLSEVEKEMGDISKQQQKSTLDDQRAAKAKELLAKAELAEAKAARERTKSIIEQDKELDRLISKEEKAKRAVQAQAGSYNALKKELRELYAIVNAAPKGSAVVFQGNTLAYDQAIQKLKELSAAEQDYRRQFAKDQLLVGEYTTGIIQAFKQLGADDLIGGQIQKANDKLKQLDQTFKGLKADYDAIKNTGVGAFDAIEKEMLQNRKEAESIKNELQGINNRLQSVDQVGTSVTTALRDGFKGAVRELTTYALGFASLQALLNTGRKTFDTTIALDSLDASLKVVSKSAEELAKNEAFLLDITDRLGLVYVDTSASFRNFFASYTEAGGSTDEARQIFENAASAAANLKLSQDDLNGALVAFGQIASKGKVKAEELTGQIGERVPGAFAIAARAIGVSQQELNKMLERGEVISTEFLPKFAAELKRSFGGGTDEVQGLQASVNRLKNEFSTLIKENQQGLTSFFNGLIGVSSVLLGMLGFLPQLLTLLGLYGIGWAILNKELVLSQARLLLVNAQLIASRVALGAVNLALAISTIAQKAYNTALLLFTGVQRAASTATILFGNALKLLPLGLILTVIGVVVASFRAFGSAVVGSTDALRKQAIQQEINLQISEKVNQATANEISKIQTLTKIAQARNISDQTRYKALQDLISIAPEYLKGLTLENIRTSEGIGLINRYVAALREKASVEAAQAVRGEILQKDLKLELLQTKLEGRIASGKGVEIEDLTPEEQEFLGTARKQFSFTASVTDLFTGASAAQEAVDGIKAARSKLLQELDVTDDIISKKLINTVSQTASGVAAPVALTVDGLQKQIEDLNKSIDGAVIGSSELQALIKKREALQEQLNNALNKGKSGGNASSRLTGTQKDEFKEIEANMTAAINAEKLKAAEIRKVRDLTADEEIASLQTIAKIELVALDQKIAKLKGANAEERRLIQEFNLEKTEKEDELQQAIQSVRDRAFDKANAEIKQRFDEQKAALQTQLDLVLDNPLSSQKQKVQATMDFNEKLLEIQRGFNFIQQALEVQYKQTSIENERERANAILTIEKELTQARSKFPLAKIADIEAQGKLSVQSDLTIINRQRENILNSNASFFKKQKALSILQREERKVILAGELNAEKLALDEYKKAFEERAITEQLYLEKYDAYVKKLGELKAELANEESGQNRQSTNLNELIQNNISSLFGFSKDSAEEKLLAETLTQAYSIAQAQMTAYFQQEEALIERSKQNKLELLDAEKQAALDAAQSAEERTAIEKKFREKEFQINKAAFEANKKLQLKQAAINLAIQLSNLAVIAFAPNPMNIATLGTAGAIMYGIQAALALANYALNVGRIKSQQFAEGGQVQPVDAGNGKLSMASNIPMQPNGDNVLATVRTGEVILNEKQQRALGGAATFARIGVPGFAGGGLIGESINRVMYEGAQAPVVGVDGQGNLRFGTGESAFDSVLASIQEQSRQMEIQNEKIAFLAASVSATDKKSVVATEVEAKIKSKKAASDYASF